jgi:hypothetical protein
MLLITFMKYAGTCFATNYFVSLYVSVTEHGASLLILYEAGE